MNSDEIFTTEYLVVIDQKTSKALYNLVDSSSMLNKMLQNESPIKIQNNQVIFNKDKFKYHVIHGVVPEKTQRYFYVTIKAKTTELVSYSKALKEMRTVFKNQGFIVETLQDDISFFYSKRAYSMIHEIESLMRKFITFFMITKVGKDWVSNNLPKNVKDSIAKAKNRNYASELQKIDFKDLGPILFDDYQNDSNARLHKEIESYKDNENVPIKQLKALMPKSNWTRFFNKHVNIEGPSLKKKWERLYELRNVVAHTSSLNSTQFEEIHELVEELKPELEKAFANLEEVKLNNSDRLAISEKIATTLDVKVGDYFNEIALLQEEIKAIDPSQKELPLTELVKSLIDSNRIEKSTGLKVQKLIQLKDSVSFEGIPSNENIVELANRINDVQKQIQKTWSKEVFLAIEELGGYSTLEDVYKQVESQTQRHLFGSWKTSVRRAIYSNSSDVELFNGKYDIYKQVSKGVWMIRKNIAPKMLDEFLGSKNAES
ncbi:HEPN domain-containing protein [Colwellia sp. RSH04]|uniref:HEPN domain-containing protein n=1 Tax=Colwellia sp. RSH04 TaxID=2305464 RepID=UPI000E593EE8|nr:HEPN domain-containing protein [Colwellia sp. RSH04]RHW76732.1 hypothetical protein D1094_06525 [Colwellia sp. RSH04]